MWDEEEAVWMNLCVHLCFASALAKLMYFNHITVQNCNGLGGVVSVTATVIGQSDVIKHIGTRCTVCVTVVCENA